MEKLIRLLTAAVVIAALAGAGFVIYRSLQDRRDVPSPARGPGADPDQPKVIDLYFADADSRRLALEAREVTSQGLEDSIHQVLRELIAGPQKGSLSPTVPGDVGIRSVYFRDGVAYVDLTSNSSGTHPGGSWTELLTVYSIINTVTENFSDVDRVQLLIEGREHETLAGHVDISRPLPGRIQLLAGDW